MIQTTKPKGRQAWFYALTPEQQAEITDLVRQCQDGSMPKHITITDICRAAKQQYGIPNAVDTMRRFFNEQPKSQG